MPSTFSASRILHAVVLCVASAVLWADASLAADYPKKPIQIVVPYNVGGGVDLFARAVGEFSQKYWGQSLVVINKDGAGGELGYNYGAHAKPDGYTLTAIVLPNIIYQPRVREKGVEGYQVEDFDQIGTLTVLPNAVFVPIDSPFKTWDDVVKKAKANPGTVTAGITGAKNTTDGFLLQLESAANIDLKRVTYTGGAPLMKDVVGGHVDLMLANSMFIETAKDTMRCLGLASAERYEYAPDVPTFKEQGTDVVDSLTRGIGVPRGTPADIVAYLDKGLQAMAKDPEFKTKMVGLGLPISYLNSQQTQSLIDDFIARNSWLFDKFE